MIPVKMKYITLNKKYIDNIVSTKYNINPIENHRLISKIDDDGNVNGSLLMINHK